jgi:hypothetical protein
MFGIRAVIKILRSSVGEGLNHDARLYMTTV